MSDDVTIRAARAQQLLEDEVLQEALGGVVAEALYKVSIADLSNSSQCVAAAAAFQASEVFSGRLREMITSGKQAERNGLRPYKVA